METDSSWIWSSEKAMLDFVATRHNLKVVEGPNELPVDTLQTYKLDGKTWEVDATKVKIVKTYTYGQSSNPWSYAPTEIGPTRMSQHRAGRHPYEHDATWEDFETNGQDVPFDPAVRELPRQGVSFGSNVHFVAADKPGSTPYEERKIAAKVNKLVTNADFHNEVTLQYPMGKKGVVCSTFDYTLANQTNTKGGYYLYMEVVDDPDIIVRLFLDEKSGVSEERVMRIASEEYVYEIEVGTKRWTAYTPGRINDQTAGFVIIHAERAVLKWGGGIGDRKYELKRGKVLQ
jgi:hypothetical protein